VGGASCGDFYFGIVHARYTLDWKGRRATILAIIGFLTVLFTYVGWTFMSTVIG